jgi:hemolysin III
MDTLLHLREPVNAWSHGTWLLLSIPGTLLLWRRSRGDLGKQLALLVYGLSLVFCFGASTLFHGVRGPRARIETFALFDYIGIYLLIAGTYTPVAWSLMSVRWRSTLLGSVWLAALLGAGVNLIFGTLPLMLTTSLYLGMGWGAVFCYYEIARTLSHREMAPIVLGGVLYSAGAVLNVLHWPVLWPGVFQHHELFHVFVMAGSLAHFGFMLDVVAPAEPSRLAWWARPAPQWLHASWSRLGQGLRRPLQGG